MGLDLFIPVYANKNNNYYNDDNLNRNRYVN